VLADVLQIRQLQERGEGAGVGCVVQVAEHAEQSGSNPLAGDEGADDVGRQRRAAMATCFDDPDHIDHDLYCLDAISKNVKGTVRIARARREVHTKDCPTFRTLGPLKLITRTNEPCDSELSLRLDNGSFTVERLATAYELDGLRRGFHAGDFVWTGQHVTVEGRISGITNAGILRAPVFKGDCEACETRGIMIGRLCGEVVGSAGPLNRAQVVAVYRFKAGRPTRRGASGGVVGTIERVIVRS
jgi:hypothetical protein